MVERFASDGEALVEAEDDGARGCPAEGLCREGFFIAIVGNEDGVCEGGEAGILDPEEGALVVHRAVVQIGVIRADVCHDGETREVGDALVEPVGVGEASKDGEPVVGACDHAIGEAVEPLGEECCEQFLVGVIVCLMEVGGSVHGVLPLWLREWRASEVGYGEVGGC